MDIKNSRMWRSRLWRLIGFFAMLITFAILINLYGIYLLGSLENWQTWRAESYEYFLAWRLALYTFLIWRWQPLRKQLLEREPEVGCRLKRTEILAGCTCALFEISRAHAYGLWGSA